MSNLMAKLESKIATEPEGETPEGEEPESEQLTALGEDEAAETDPDESPAEGEEMPESDELADEAEFTLDGEKITGKQLREERMMRADYTRKTQALAKEREALADMREEAEELKEWIGGLGDVDSMAFELERHFPEAFEALRDRIIAEAIEEQELDEKQIEWRRKARKAEIDLKAREKDEALAKRREERKQASLKTAELTKTFDGWLVAVMQENGLDPKNERHQRLIRNEIRGSYQGTKWTKETFQAAAKDVAKDLNLKAPPAKDPPKGPPAARDTGIKAPAKKSPKASKPAKATDSGSYFDNLRRSVGLR